MSIEEAIRLRDYGLTLDPNVVICDRRAVDEAVDKLEELDTHRRKVLAENERFLSALIEANRKLAELAAENERWRDRVEANNEWHKAYNELTGKTEAALAERDKEIDWQRLCDAINGANRVSARTGAELVMDANKLREFALARNAGGKDGR